MLNAIGGRFHFFYFFLISLLKFTQLREIHCSSLLVKMQSSQKLKPAERKSTGKAFLGKLQPVQSRVPAVPTVNYAKGGSDFRCPQNTSSMGKQAISGVHMHHRVTEPRVKFCSAPRFAPSTTIGVGPAALAPYSSVTRQKASNKRTAGTMTFGTSSRSDAWKTYTIYTAKHN